MTETCQSCGGWGIITHAEQPAKRTPEKLQQFAIDAYQEGAKNALLTLCDGFMAVGMDEAADMTRGALAIVESNPPPVTRRYPPERPCRRTEPHDAHIYRTYGGKARFGCPGVPTGNESLATTADGLSTAASDTSTPPPITASAPSRPTDDARE